MKGIATSITGTALAGLVVLLPLAILFIAIAEIWDMLEGMAAISELQLPFPRIVNALIIIALIALGVFLVCLLVGLLLKTSPGKRFSQFLEKVVMEKVPLLGLVRNLTLSITGGTSQFKPVEADIYGSGTHMLGFLIESLPDSRCVVFIPSVPAVTLGHTYLVPAERVRILDASVTSMINSITQWGVGTAELYQSAGGEKAEPENKLPQD